MAITGSSDPTKLKLADGVKRTGEGGTNASQTAAPASVSVFSSKLDLNSGTSANTSQITLGNPNAILSFKQDGGKNTITMSDEYNSFVGNAKGQGQDVIQQNLDKAESTDVASTKAAVDATKNKDTAQANADKGAEDVKAAEGQKESARTSYEASKKVRNDYEAKVETLTETGTKLKGEISSIKGEISALKSKLAAQGAVDKTGSAYAAIEKQITAKEAELKKKEAEYNTNQKQLDEQKGLLAKAELSLDKAEDQLGVSDRLVLGAKATWSALTSVVSGAGQILSGVLGSLGGQQGQAISTLTQMLGGNNNGGGISTGNNSQQAAMLAANQMGNSAQQAAVNQNALVYAGAKVQSMGLSDGIDFSKVASNSNTNNLGNLLNGSAGRIGASGTPAGMNNMNNFKFNMV